MKGWQALLEDAPTRVKEVITEGPFPLAEYDGHLTHKDKRMGIMRYKGGDGRNQVNNPMKNGGAAVVYYDPAFASPEYTPLDIPEEIQEQHDMASVKGVFQEI